MKRLKTLFIAVLLLCISLNTALAGSILPENESLFIECCNTGARHLFTKDGNILFALANSYKDGRRIDALALFDTSGNLLWKTNLPVTFSVLAFSFCEREDGDFAISAVYDSGKHRDFILMRPDGTIYEHKKLSDEMLNPHVVKDGFVYTQIDKSTNERLLCKTTCDNKTSKVILEDCSTAACVIAETGKNNTYGYCVVTLPEGRYMQTILVAINNKNEKAWVEGVEDYVSSTWHEFDNGDTLVCMQTEKDSRSYIKRLDIEGNTLWKREIIGEGTNFSPVKIFENADGSISAAGYAGIIDSPSADSCAFIVTFDPENGNCIDGCILGPYSVALLGNKHMENILLKEDEGDALKFTETVPLSSVMSLAKSKVELR